MADSQLGSPDYYSIFLVTIRLSRLASDICAWQTYRQTMQTIASPHTVVGQLISKNQHIQQPEMWCKNTVIKIQSNTEKRWNIMNAFLLNWLTTFYQYLPRSDADRTLHVILICQKSRWNWHAPSKIVFARNWVSSQNKYLQFWCILASKNFQLNGIVNCASSCE